MSNFTRDQNRRTQEFSEKAIRYLQEPDPIIQFESFGPNQEFAAHAFKTAEVAIKAYFLAERQIAAQIIAEPYRMRDSDFRNNLKKLMSFQKYVAEARTEFIDLTGENPDDDRQK